MRIGIDARHLTNPAQSGIGHYTREVLQRLVEAHPEHRFVILTTGSPKARIVAETYLGDLLQNPHVVHLHHSIMNRVLYAQIRFTKTPTYKTLFKRHPIDVIWAPNLNILPTSHVPLVLTFHDLSFHLFRHLLPWKSRLWHRATQPANLALRADHVIVPSRSTASDLQALYGVPKKKITVVPHGVDNLFSPTPPPRDHGVRSRLALPKHYVLFVGTDEPRKNLDRLCEAIQDLRKTSSVAKRLDLYLVLAGSGTTSRTAPGIKGLGYIDDKDLPALFRGAEALVYPSLYEGFGIPIVQAFASDTPVITSQTSAMLEVGGSAALFVDPENPKDIARTIEAILEDPSLKTHLIHSGQAVAKTYDWHKAAEATLDVLKQVTETQRRGETEKHRNKDTEKQKN